MTIHSVITPIWLSYRFQNAKSKGLGEMRLEQWLKIKLAEEAFFKFSQQEFSSENLAFFLRVNVFREKAAALATIAAQPAQTNAIAGLLAEAQTLYNTFIVAEAPFQVNLPGEQTACIGEALTKLSEASLSDRTVPKQLETLFDAARAGARDTSFLLTLSFLCA